MPTRDYNPFAQREEFSRQSLLAYKNSTILSWLLLVVVGTYYTFDRPADCHHHNNCHTIWGQNSHRKTPFSLSPVVTNIYWITVLIMQLDYIRFLWSADKFLVTIAANVGSHFILNNLLQFGFIMLWVRGYFWQGELLLIVNSFNLTNLYFWHPSTPRWIHIPVVSAPLAWNYIALLWDGAAMVNAHSLPARIVANVFIWSILGVGVFFILIFGDSSMGIELAILSLAIAVGQIETHVIALQWIFAFVIAGALLFLSLLVGVPPLSSQSWTVRFHGIVVSEDSERAPLLVDH